MCHLRVYDPLAGCAGLAVVQLPAGEAVRHSLHWYVLVASQRQVAHPAAEVLHVPESPLGRRVLRGEDELVTGLAPRDVHLGGEVSSTEEVTLNYNIVIPQKR